MLILNDEGEARGMIVRKMDGKEHLLVELGKFPAKAKKGWHCGYEIYVREK